MIRRFVAIGLAGSFARMMYFAIPDYVWGQPVVPEEPNERFSLPCFGAALVAAADVARGARATASDRLARFAARWPTAPALAARLPLPARSQVDDLPPQGVILYFWLAAYNALRSRKPHQMGRPEQLYAIAVAVYALAELVLCGVYFGVPFFTVALVHSALQCICSLGIAIFFVTLFWQLRSALGPAESASLIKPQQSQGADYARSEAGGSSLMGTTRLSSTGYGSIGAQDAPREPPATSEADAERERKMTKIQLVASVCAFANVFRGCVMIYQCVLLSGGHLAFPKAWWVVIIVDYTLTEAFAFAAVLLVLRKPSKPAPAAEPLPRRRLLSTGAPPSGSAAPHQPGSGGRSRVATGSTVTVVSSPSAPAGFQGAPTGADGGNRGRGSLASSSGAATAASAAYAGMDAGGRGRADSQGEIAWAADDGNADFGNTPPDDGLMGDHGGFGHAQRRGSDFAMDEEPGWADEGGDYSLVLATTPTAPPAPVAAGAAGAAYGRSRRGDDGHGLSVPSSSRSPGGGGASEPVAVPGRAQGSSGFGGTPGNATLGADGDLVFDEHLAGGYLKPVKESVESDAAFPAGMALRRG
ncbi:unnamed protein product [Symbiodinium sp. KB8]|nr:unnamed protein product [Symbiodinium sp. KB8]